MFDHAAACAELGLTKLLFHDRQFVADDGRDALRLGQDVEQIVDFGHHVFVFVDDLVLLEAGQTLQAHLQDFVGLGVAQTVEAVRAHAEFFF